MHLGKKILQSNEMTLCLLLILFVITIGLINPAFFSIGTMFDVIRNQTIYILLAFGLLPVVILGGLDISFVAVASLATLVSRISMAAFNYDGGMWFFYFSSMLVGICAGSAIAWMIWAFKTPIFDFSLGMSTMIGGFLALTSQFRPREWNFSAIEDWSMKWLVTVQSTIGISGLHVSFLLVVFSGLILHFFLRHTVLGREIYALGSDKSVAIRTGINVKRAYMTAFSILGAMAAMAAVTNTGLGLGASSFNAKYLTVYATVIIGGGSIHGGKGSIVGTLMGVLLVGLIAQAMVYVRIPTAWMDAVLGGLIITFTIYQTFQTQLQK
jgi:simple sugar transport system permease protein